MVHAWNLILLLLYRYKIALHKNLLMLFNDIVITLYWCCEKNNKKYENEILL